MSERHLAPLVDEIRRDLERQYAADSDARLAVKEREIASKTSELAERDKKFGQTQETLEAALKELAQMRAEKVGFSVEIEKARLAGADEARQELTQTLEEQLELAEKRGKGQAVAELQARHNLDKQQAAATIESLRTQCGQLEVELAAGARDHDELVRTITAQAQATVAEQIESLTMQCGQLEAQLAAGARDHDELVRTITAQAETTAAQQIDALRAQLSEQAAAAQEELRVAREARESSENQLRDQLRRSEDDKAQLRVETASLRDQFDDEVREKAVKLAEDSTRKERARAEAKSAATIEDLRNQLASVTAELEKAHQHAFSFGIRRLPEGVIRQELFAEELRKRWPQDDIVVVRSGQKGADVHQTVVENGQVCGVIVWECKATKKYNKAWIEKLIKDRDEKRAQIAVLVTEAMPTVPAIEGSGWIDGILVCDFETAVHVAGPFRQMIATVRQHELTDAARGDQTPERVYTYITGSEFMYCLEKIVKMAQMALDEMAHFRRHVNRLYGKLDTAQQEIIDTICTIAGRFEATGTIVPPQLRGELPSNERLALPPGDD
ncbi:DUF2130 domain-containing protein [Nocardia transvalensis]|uniref:DUF2130 domain-containing protein n=1 Tax=Nocardia transvalensis TaxID=37333 RepID=UPI0018950883|nr:DUF2130 domain-containing protein [Nocardia transvalensis]MBF6333224.1 DUF2130 domain-containing protein [Nocardia transvalensis]